jgi:hypothetical protein
MTRTSAALSWLRRIFWSAKLARIGLTTFTPTTISCAVARPGAMKKIPTKKAALDQRRFMPCMRSPGRWATDSTKPSRGWQGDGEVPVTALASVLLTARRCSLLPGDFPSSAAFFWPRFPHDRESEPPNVRHAPSRAYEERPQSKGFPVRSVIDSMPMSEIADAATR